MTAGMCPDMTFMREELAREGPRDPALQDSTEAVKECDLSPASFAKFARYITQELGIKMPESKATMVQSRLLRRVRELRLNTVEQYAEYFFASSHAVERDHFINAITTNKTDFFRERDHLVYLTGTVLPAFSRLAGARFNYRLNVWSAGCSSGEEAYTLAMLLSEYSEQNAGFSFAILGTDISTRVLDHARNGIYRTAQIEPVPPQLRRKYLLQSRDKSRQQIRITPELRRKVSFHRLNFMDENYGVKDLFDVIFFRNVMIYFDRATQESVINKLCRNLAPGGYFFAGHSESLAGLNIPLRSVKTAIFRKPL